MIIPDGTKLILDPIDEYMHEPEPVSNYNESMYFNGFDLDKGLGLWVRVGNRPNEGHAEVSCCIYLPDGRVGFMFVKPELTSHQALNAADMRFEVIRPFEHLKVSYDGRILLLDNPHEMADPGTAFKTNPRVSCRIDLDVYGVSPMHGGEIVNLDGSPWQLDPETAVFRGHTEQHTHVVGTLSVSEEKYAIDGYGFRDKSWGPRFWQSFYWYKWLPMTFGPDFGIMLALMGRKGDKPFVNGHVFLNGTLHSLVDASVEVEWDVNYYQKKLVARLRTHDEEFEVRGEVVSLVPLRHRRVQPDGNDETARITEGMMRFSCRGRTALGMSEFLDLIVEGLPISAAGQVSG